MGWCSATVIFDKVAAFVLASTSSEEDQYQVLLTLADALEDNDWDCQSDSAYYNHPLVQRIMNELHPDWADYEEDE